jgi:hypothetical protein
MRRSVIFAVLVAVLTVFGPGSSLAKGSGRHRPRARDIGLLTSLILFPFAAMVEVKGDKPAPKSGARKKTARPTPGGATAKPTAADPSPVPAPTPAPTAAAPAR